MSLQDITSSVSAGMASTLLAAPSLCSRVDHSAWLPSLTASSCSWSRFWNTSRSAVGATACTHREPAASVASTVMSEQRGIPAVHGRLREVIALLQGMGMAG